MCVCVCVYSVCVHVIVCACVCERARVGEWTAGPLLSSLSHCMQHRDDSGRDRDDWDGDRGRWEDRRRSDDSYEEGHIESSPVIIMRRLREDVDKEDVSVSVHRVRSCHSSLERCEMKICAGKAWVRDYCHREAWLVISISATTCMCVIHMYMECSMTCTCRNRYTMYMYGACTCIVPLMSS